MFGYIRPYKPEMRFKEYDAYKAVYCSLCKYIGKKYGKLLRFTLSYDFTFLVLLNMSLDSKCACFEKKHCVYNPLKKCTYLSSYDGFEMPAAASTIMIYYKLCDNIQDEGVFKTIFYKILKTILKRSYKKAAADYPKLNDIFKNYIQKQNELEANKIYDLDRAADPTANMLSSLFAMCSKSGEERALKRMGYCMGRWIYIIDAGEDLEDDIKRKRYNPLIIEAQNKDNINKYVKTRLEPSLNMCAAGAAEAFELIDICKFKNIMGNIIYLGLENSEKLVFSKEKVKQ